MKLKVVLDKDAKMPTKAHSEDAGFDLYSREDKLVPAHSSCSFDTGVHIEIPVGYVGFIKSKSGLNVKHSLQTEGVIDAGYTGTLVVKMCNHSDKDYFVEKGNKITQLVLLPIPVVELYEVQDLEETDRGNKGFGSSGK